MPKAFNVGLIGCGHIAETYFRAHKYFNNFKIIKCADINKKAADKCAKIYKIKSVSVNELLKDKDIDAVIAPLKSVINKWYIAGLDGSRGMTAAALTEKVATIVGSQKTINCLTVKQAYQQAMVDSEQDDRVLIFGSFHTVEAAMRLIPECLDKEKL